MTTRGVFYSIDDAARMTARRAHTLRYHEEVGLLGPPHGTEGGRRNLRDNACSIERIKELLGMLHAAYHGNADPAHRRARGADAGAPLSEQSGISESMRDCLMRVRDDYHARQHRLEVERDRFRAVLVTSGKEER